MADNDEQKAPEGEQTGSNQPEDSKESVGDAPQGAPETGSGPSER